MCVLGNSCTHHDTAAIQHYSHAHLLCLFWMAQTTMHDSIHLSSVQIEMCVR